MLHPAPTERELAVREADEGLIQVGLYWHPVSNTVRLEAHDRRRGCGLNMRVPGEDALFAFKHPFAYAEAKVIG